MTYSVLWKGLWLNLSKYMMLVVCIPLLLLGLTGYIKSGFDFGATFLHLDSTNPLIIAFFAGLSCIFFSLLIAIWIRIAKVSVHDGIIQGRNYWGFKNSFPLEESVSLSKFSNNGINAIVLKSKKSGKIYISDYTERLNELLTLIDPFIVKNSENNK